MKAVRRFGLLLVILLLGMLLGNLGLRNAVMVFAPLFIIWFISWDEKKYRQTKRKKYAESQYYNHYYY